VPDYLEANRANWDDRASLHAARNGFGYETQRYVDDREGLSEVVRFDLDRLGDVAGLRAVHLQCHIGTDTISLARLGARVIRPGLLPGRHRGGADAGRGDR
jgi:hypothetical protein